MQAVNIMLLFGLGSCSYIVTLQKIERKRKEEKMNIKIKHVT
jgi:hypothetical protein